MATISLNNGERFSLKDHSLAFYDEMVADTNDTHLNITPPDYPINNRFHKHTDDILKLVVKFINEHYDNSELNWIVHFSLNKVQYEKEYLDQYPQQTKHEKKVSEMLKIEKQLEKAEFFELKKAEYVSQFFTNIPKNTKTMSDYDKFNEAWIPKIDGNDYDYLTIIGCCHMFSYINCQIGMYFIAKFFEDQFVSYGSIPVN